MAKVVGGRRVVNGKRRRRLPSWEASPVLARLYYFRKSELINKISGQLDS